MAGLMFPCAWWPKALGEEIRWDGQTSTIFIGDVNASKVLTAPVFASKVDELWPAGTYRIEISLNGTPAQEKSITVA